MKLKRGYKEYESNGFYFIAAIDHSRNSKWYFFIIDKFIRASGFQEHIDDKMNLFIAGIDT